MLTIALLGCGRRGDGPVLLPVSGTVTYEGAPVVNGTIFFLPEGGRGRPDAGPVINGKFAFTCTAGKKRVEIKGRRDVPEKSVPSANPGEPPVPLEEQFLPARYNLKSELSVDVSASGPNDFQFELFAG